MFSQKIKDLYDSGYNPLDDQYLARCKIGAQELSLRENTTYHVLYNEKGKNFYSSNQFCGYEPVIASYKNGIDNTEAANLELATEKAAKNL